MIRNVEFKYPRLGSTYKFNTAEKRSEECNPRAQGATYSIGWEMSKDDATKLYAELKAHYESCQTNDPFTKVFGMKPLENGNVMFSAKRNGVNKQGDENPKPTVVDGMKQPLADLNFWSGSTGSIKVTAYPVTDPNGVGGISLLIDKVQVVNAQYSGGDLDDFDEVAPATTAPADDPFGLPPIQEKPKPAPAAAFDMEDEIPF